MTQPYYTDGSCRSPRYYQRVAVNRAIEAVARGQDRLLLVMATGTGKTYTAFQIIWRLWKAKNKKRILFLADRNILVDQTMLQDFSPFGEVMHKITNREVKKNYEIYLSLYQAVTGNEEWKQIYRQFPSDFFDLVVIDECHRGSASEDSAWREVLDYFDSATHLGLTATPKETRDTSNITYFGEPIYTYSLKQGIEDGFLAPYKVIRVVTDVDAVGYTPEWGKTDKHGHLIEHRQWAKKFSDKPQEETENPLCELKSLRTEHEALEKAFDDLRFENEGRKIAWKIHVGESPAGKKNFHAVGKGGGGEFFSKRGAEFATGRMGAFPACKHIVRMGSRFRHGHEFPGNPGKPRKIGQDHRRHGSTGD